MANAKVKLTAKSIKQSLVFSIESWPAEYFEFGRCTKFNTEKFRIFDSNNKINTIVPLENMWILDTGCWHFHNIITTLNVRKLQFFLPHSVKRTKHILILVSSYFALTRSLFMEFMNNVFLVFVVFLDFRHLCSHVCLYVCDEMNENNNNNSWGVIKTGW